MSIFNDDRATLNDIASNLDLELSNCGLDEVLHKGFDAGLNLDEILYIMSTHTERIVKRYIVQDQLKKAANKDKN